MARNVYGSRESNTQMYNTKKVVYAGQRETEVVFRIYHVNVMFAVQLVCFTPVLCNILAAVKDLGGVILCLISEMIS